MAMTRRPTEARQWVRSHGRERTGYRVALVTCTLAIAILVFATHTLTRGFEAWTYDDRRALDLQRGLLVARPLALLTSRGESLQLWGSSPHAPRAYLVDFVYTACPGVCQVLGSEFARMQAALRATGDGSAVGLLSISFDVERDDQAALAAYARLHRADGSTWIVAVPQSADTSRRLLQELQVVVVPDGSGGYVHNGGIHLLDGHGRLRGLFAFDEWERAMAAAQRLAAPKQ